MSTKRVTLLSCYTYGDNKAKHKQEFAAECKMILMYIERVKKLYPDKTDVLCGYEAGCLGYTLYHQLKNHGVKCVILAPTTMAVSSRKGIKTDKRDAENIAKCLAFNTYNEVHIPTEKDEAVKEYIRMRDDQKKALKINKQQILAFVLRHGCRFDGGKNYRTMKHLKWLKSLQFGGILQETFDEYMITYEYLTNKIERLDKRIEELAQDEAYKESVKKLICLIGVKTLTAMSVLTEIGDFKRFAGAEQFASYLGLVPGEDSSGDRTHRLGITKAGNSHIRRLLTEAAQGYTRGKVGYKSADLKRRQDGNTPQVIAYADKANERLRRKFYRMILQNKTHRNVAATAIAREIACFMWGLMTDNIA